MEAMDRKGASSSKRRSEDLQAKCVKSRKHTTDTMPDVLGAIEAVKRKDQAGIKFCNRSGEPLEPNRYGLTEYHAINIKE